jgi:hypothetical protein
MTAAQYLPIIPEFSGKNSRGKPGMAHDSEYFRRRAEEARASSFSKHDGDGAAVAGDLALAYAALARHRAAAAAEADVEIEEIPLAVAD